MLDLQITDQNSLNTVKKLALELRNLIDHAKQAVAISVNANLVLLYWHVGKKIHEEVLLEMRADYGDFVIIELSKELTSRYGQGFSRPNLFRMVSLSKYFTDKQEINKIAQSLSWSHLVEIISLENNLQRQFYSEMCKIERWSVRTLRKKIQGMLFERISLSKKTETIIQDELQALKNCDQFTTDFVFQDPYLLDFLNLQDKYSEHDLEGAIIHELEKFILEFGTDFCFIARQKRLTVGGVDYHIDLLFFHRRLNRLIAIELKLGEFLPSYKGQMELYLRWLDKYERRIQEEKPLGIILCARKNQELIELLELNQTGIHVAEYLTELPPLKDLEEKFHRAVLLAREKVANLHAMTELQRSEN